MPPQLTRRLAGALGLLGVALGAFGAHALRARLIANGMTEVWEKAVLYHLVHAVALLALSYAPLRAPRIPVICFATGLVIFSGSLYTLAFTGVKILGAITPVGGVLLLAGWICLAIGCSDTPAE